MLPKAFLNRMQSMLGEEFNDFLKTFEEEKYQALRVNGLKKNIKKIDISEATGIQLTPVPWAEDGFYYNRDARPGKHPYHEAGVYYIQEPSAMAPVEFLEVKPGDKVLDLCAAPGGKSTQIAAKLMGQGLLVCNEIHPARARILSENIERMGVVNACVTNETPDRLSLVFPGYFDKILVDAPCSGEGMFRKNEEACGEWSTENVELCAKRQDEILDCAVTMLRPGGRLVYSTCTFAPDENEGSIDRLLSRCDDMEVILIDKESKGLTGGDGVPEYVASDREELRNTLRLWPHKIQGEGHFAAVLQKKGIWEENQETIAIGGLEKGLSTKDEIVKEYMSFASETLKTDKIPDGFILLKFGNNLYMAPDCMPALKGLKVLRPGLHLGEQKKNRFEPSHALALALSASEVQRFCDLNSQEAQVGLYLNGQTFSMEGDKGWYLICTDGYSLGWGKLAGGIMKNHYPKGLRKV